MSHKESMDCNLTIHFKETLAVATNGGEHYKHLHTFTDDENLVKSDGVSPLNKRAPLPKAGELVSVIDTLTAYEVIERSYTYHENGDVEIFIAVKPRK